MCGRFALVDLPRELSDEFDLEVPSLEPRGNIPPGQPVVALITDSERRAPLFQRIHWGFVPFWAKEPKGGRQPINAKAETADVKPTFRAAFRHRRCLIPATGFYEWKKEGKARTPFILEPAAGGVMALAGIWDDWTDGVTHLRTLAILTTSANGAVAEIHDRMPVIVPREGWRAWVDPRVQRRDELAEWLESAPETFLKMRRMEPL